MADQVVTEPDMTAPPRTLQERLREFIRDREQTHSDVSQACGLCKESLATLNAQSKLLAEAREALEHMLTWFGKPMREEWLTNTAFEQAKAVAANARAVLAKLKGASHD